MGQRRHRRGFARARRPRDRPAARDGGQRRASPQLVRAVGRRAPSAWERPRGWPDPCSTRVSSWASMALQPSIAPPLLPTRTSSRSSATRSFAPGTDQPAPRQGSAKESTQGGGASSGACTPTPQSPTPPIPQPRPTWRAISASTERSGPAPPSSRKPRLVPPTPAPGRLVSAGSAGSPPRSSATTTSKTSCCSPRSRLVSRPTPRSPRSSRLTTQSSTGCSPT